MFELFIESLNRWNTVKSERQKLQYSYIALTLLIILVAGIVSLFEARVGHDIVRLALIALGTFAVNAVMWNLLQSSLLSRLPSKPKRR
jgi:hypothetical protein